MHGRGPQRQVARLPAGNRQGDRAPPHREVRRRLPHRGPRRGHSQGRPRFARRLPQPHVGRDVDRRAQEGRRAGHRDAREGRARLVRRRRGDADAQRRHQHRHPHSHHLSARRNGFLSRGRDAAVRFRAGHGRARNAPQGDRLFPHPGRARSRSAAGGGGAQLRRQGDSAAAGG